MRFPEAASPLPGIFPCRQGHSHFLRSIKSATNLPLANMCPVPRSSLLFAFSWWVSSDLLEFHVSVLSGGNSDLKKKKVVNPPWSAPSLLLNICKSLTDRDSACSVQHFSLHLAACLTHTRFLGNTDYIKSVCVWEGGRKFYMFSYLPMSIALDVGRGSSVSSSEK